MLLHKWPACGGYDAVVMVIVDEQHICLAAMKFISDKLLSLFVFSIKIVSIKYNTHLII